MLRAALRVHSAAASVGRLAAAGRAGALPARGISRTSAATFCSSPDQPAEQVPEPEVAQEAADAGWEAAAPGRVPAHLEDLPPGYDLPRRPGSRALGTYYQGQYEHAEEDDPPFRQPRPFLKPIKNLKDRQIPALREHAASKAWGGLIDIIEHDMYHQKIADGDSGGAFHDFQVAPYDSECPETPFYNSYLTEDEFTDTGDYLDGDDGELDSLQDDAGARSPRFIPDRVRNAMYFLWSERGWGLPDIARRFKVSTARASFIINLKRTEPECIAQGTYSEDMDKAIEALADITADYDQGSRDPEYPEDMDAGLNVAFLKDAQLPDDVVPVKPWRGNALRLGLYIPPADAAPPKSERRHKHPFAIKDISPGQGTEIRLLPYAFRHRVVDYDGTVRQASQVEEIRRTNRARRFFISRKHGHGSNHMPFPDAAANMP